MSEVLEVGEPMVFPPDDMVDFGVPVAHTAARDCTGWVEGSQGAALGPVGETGGSTEIEHTRRRYDHTVSNDDAVVVYPLAHLIDD